MGLQKCWSCTKYAGGCSWSREFKPVPGWEAEPRTYGARPKYKVPEVNSYEIVACPEYVWDGTDPRDTTDDEGQYRWKNVERMMQVRGLARAGRSAWEISRVLHIGYSTVKSYLSRLKRLGELENVK